MRPLLKVFVEPQQDTASKMPPLSSTKLKILKAIARRKNGLTDEELSLFLGCPTSGLRGRRSELAKHGLVASTTTRTTSRGRTTRVWIITTKGQKQLDRSKP